ncbi:MAG TPA: hypothetical protein VFN56_00255 [Candidatus Saccharimonadales bacterium]|nr:hypothetical protein [Candidatus Saccharimonadales bacterium]
MIIVGLTGGIGHGKTTLAKFLSSHATRYVHMESSDLIMEVANAFRQQHEYLPDSNNIADINRWLSPLPSIIEEIVHCKTNLTNISVSMHDLQSSPDSYEKLIEYLQLMLKRPALRTVKISQSNKQLFRCLLQWLGGYLVKKVDQGIWYNEIIRRTQVYAREGVDLITIGGVRFPGDAKRVQRAGGYVIAVNRPAVKEVDIHEVTERERELIKPDVVVINDGSLERLQKVSDRLYLDLKTHHIQPCYKASDS